MGRVAKLSNDSDYLDARSSVRYQVILLQATLALPTGLEIDRLPFVDFDSAGQYKNF
jgi:hypothetical protein